MDYLAKTQAPFSKELWNRLEKEAMGAMREALVGRRVISLYGPVGAGAAFAAVDKTDKKEKSEDGFAFFEQRNLLQIPQLYEDFWLSWRDIAAEEQGEMPLDLSPVRAAALRLAAREDSFVFYGHEKLGISGLLTAKGVDKRKKANWNEGENAFADIAAGVAELMQKGKIGRVSLIVSTDIFSALQRIQAGTGLIESERIKTMLGGKLFVSPALAAGTAVLFSAQPQYVDLLIGQDASLAYTETVDLNHHMRILETALPRVKDPEAIIVFK